METERSEYFSEWEWEEQKPYVEALKEVAQYGYESVELEEEAKEFIEVLGVEGLIGVAREQIVIRQNCSIILKWKFDELVFQPNSAGHNPIAFVGEQMNENTYQIDSWRKELAKLIDYRNKHLSGEPQRLLDNLDLDLEMIKECLRLLMEMFNIAIAEEFLTAQVAQVVHIIRLEGLLFAAHSNRSLEQRCNDGTTDPSTSTEKVEFWNQEIDTVNRLIEQRNRRISTELEAAAFE